MARPLQAYTCRLTRAAPMTVLNHDHAAARVEQRRPQRQVQLRAAAVELRAVEAVADGSVDVRGVARLDGAMIGAVAIVSILRRGRDGARFQY